MNDLAKISDDAVNPYTNKPYPKHFIKKIKSRMSKGKIEPEKEDLQKTIKETKEPKMISRINITRLPRASKDNIVEIDKMALEGPYFDVITLFSNEITFETARGPIDIKITTNPFGKNVNVVVLAFDARNERELEKLKKIKYDKDAFLYVIAVNFNRIKEALRDQYESLMKVDDPTEKQKEKLVIIAKSLKENTDELFDEKVEKVLPKATLIKINEPTEKELEEALFEIVANLQGASRTAFLGEGGLDKLEIPGKEERIKLIEGKQIPKEKESITPPKKSEIDVFDFDLYTDEFELFSKYFEKINLYLRLGIFLKYKYEILKTEEQRDALNASIDQEVEKGNIGSTDIYTFRNIITYLKSLTDKVDVPDLLRRWFEHFDPKKLEEKKFIKNKLDEYEFCEDKLFVRLYRKYVENDIPKDMSLWFHNSECDESVTKKSPKSKKSTDTPLQQMTLEELQEKCAELGIDICDNKAQSIKAIRGAMRKERTLETINKYVKEKEEKEEKQEERREEIEQKKEDLQSNIEKLSLKQLVKICKEMNINEHKCKTREKAIEAITEQRLIDDIENEMLSTPKKSKDFDPFDFAKYSQEYKMFSKYFSGQELYFRTGVFIDYKYNDLNDQQRESLERTIIDTPDFRMKEFLSKLTDDNGYQLP